MSANFKLFTFGHILDYVLDSETWTLHTVRNATYLSLFPLPWMQDISLKNFHIHLYCKIRISVTKILILSRVAMDYYPYLNVVKKITLDYKWSIMATFGNLCLFFSNLFHSFVKCVTVRHVCSISAREKEAHAYPWYHMFFRCVYCRYLAGILILAEGIYSPWHLISINTRTMSKIFH